MKGKFIPTNCGWVSEKTPPQNHKNVVLLGYHKEDEMYYEFIGYYENGKWDLPTDYEDCEVRGWFPIPYSPNNQ